MQLQKYETEQGEVLTLELATTFFTRFRGLMLRPKLPPNTGLYLAPCTSIHMMFMRFAIDAVYVTGGNDGTLIIQKVVTNLRPWLGLSMCPKAHGVIELAAGEAGRLGLTVGQLMVLTPPPLGEVAPKGSERVTP
ncbi:DUF192 domain-containing protein [uncultured Selenomonas sp.]|uniref:DUF192 domain-containing protein n=1 Tax=uncultured Selenomonas sp. TaxID=159275 RepID=UPI0025E8A37D|nr:DUF192 domain-containing protein [uncultured Selenomonas sp.]